MNRQTNFFTDKQHIQNLSTKPQEKHTYKLHQFFLACDAIENYEEAVALFGTRRLGKSVTLNQLWDKYHTNKSLYIRISENTSVDSVVSYIQERADIDFLFIDEITNILALDIYAADILDFCKAYNIKIIATGTNSYLLAVSLNQSACGRFKVISFNPPNLIDVLNIKNATLSDFLAGEKTFYQGNNYLNDISKDILRAIDYLGDYKNEPLFPISGEELIDNMKIIIELIILQKSPKLPRDGLIFRSKYYKNLDFDEVIYRTQSKKETVYYIYNILLKLGLLIELPVHSFEPVTKIYKLYLTTPVLYNNLLKEFNKQALSNKLGFLFESAVVSQLYQLLNFNSNFRIYTFTDVREEIEFDLVIEDNKNNIVYLNEIKSSIKRHSKYKNDERVNNLYSDMEIYYKDINPDNLLDTINFYSELSNQR